MSNEGRFFELAHKALAKEAPPAEEAELKALLAENSELKKQFDEMAAEAAVAREVLPLMEDIQHPAGEIPPVPMARLKHEFPEVFGPSPSLGRVLQELLGKLEAWASRQVRPERDQGMALVSALRGSLFTAPSEAVRERKSFRPKSETDLLAFSEMATFKEALPMFLESEEKLSEQESRYARIEQRMSERMDRDAELEGRLRQLAELLDQTQRMMTQCRAELNSLRDRIRHQK